jgi:hypothetical protein
MDLLARGHKRQWEVEKAFNAMKDCVDEIKEMSKFG